MSARPFPIDFATLAPDTRPRCYLVLPEGFQAAATPNASSHYPGVTPEAVHDAFLAIAQAAPRVETVRTEGGQVELVQRSKLFRFPDYITVQAFETEQDGVSGSGLAIYSRAVIGYSDMGVNRKRIQAWLARLSEHLS